MSYKSIENCFLLVAVLLFLSCGIGERKLKMFWIDNPTPNAISISIDGVSHEIPAVSGIQLGLASGKHHLVYNNDSLDFVVKPNDQDVVMNPTLGNYIFYQELYTVAGKETKESHIDAVVSAYSYEYRFNDTLVEKVPFRFTNDLFIERYEYYWHLNVNEPYRDNISISQNPSLSVMNRAKLFREEEFLDYLNTSDSNFLPEGYEFPKNTSKLSELPPFILIDSGFYSNCEEGNIAIQSLAAKFDSLALANDDETSKKLRLELSIGLDSDIRPTCKKVAPNFDSILVAFGKRSEFFGTMNAYVIKQ